MTLAAATALRMIQRLRRTLEAVTNGLVLGLVFFLVVTPTAFAMKLLRKDPLRLRKEPGAATYWIEREAGPGEAAHFLRQF